MISADAETIVPSHFSKMCKKTPCQATTAKQAKKRRASPPEYDIGSGLGQSGSIPSEVQSPSSEF